MRGGSLPDRHGPSPARIVTAQETAARGDPGTDSARAADLDEVKYPGLLTFEQFLARHKDRIPR